MKLIEIKIRVKVPEHADDIEDLVEELEADIRYQFTDITGFDIYDMETEIEEV
jgi:hypothetical protein